MGKRGCLGVERSISSTATPSLVWSSALHQATPPGVSQHPLGSFPTMRVLCLALQSWGNLPTLPCPTPQEPRALLARSQA